MSFVLGASLIKAGTCIDKKSAEQVDDENNNNNNNTRDDYRKIARKGIAKRGNIVGFSRLARRNLQRLIARVKRKELPCFVTLTYPKEFPVTSETWKRDLKVFLQRMRRAFPEFSGIWKLEPQERKAPHYHLLIWGVSCETLQQNIPLAWFEVVGSGDSSHLSWHMGQCGNGNIHCVQEVKSPRGLYTYASKYVCKPVEGWNNVGKWWGVFGRENLPVGELLTYDITDEQSKQNIRYMRRFARLKSRSYQSLTILCDADQWYEKLTTLSMGSYGTWLKKLEQV